MIDRFRVTYSTAHIALFTVPIIVALGIASGLLSGSGYGNAWFDALAKPWFMPPGWVFPVAWTTLYVLMGVSLAMLIHADARTATALFALQLALNLAWSPVFFAAHRIGAALVVIGALDLLVLLTVAAALAAQPVAALLLLPYALWLALATALNIAILRLNG